MHITIINGSPRKGNTVAAINAFAEGIGQGDTVEIIDADKLRISGCKGCDVCQCTNGCIAKDDTNPTIDKIVAADMIVFATPVYWWGVTAQTKLVIDKCYCRGALLKGKHIGVIVTGGASTDDVQYSLIEKQFECMADYLQWKIDFFKTFSATGKDELADNASVMDEMKLLGKEISK